MKKTGIWGTGVCVCQGYGVGDGECVGDCDRECARMNVWYGQIAIMVYTSRWN